MIVDILVPSVGESITEALLAEWYKQDGERVTKGEPLFVIETDKVTLEVEAEADGVLAIKVAAGQTVAIGAVVGTLDTEAVAPRAEAAREDRSGRDKPAGPEKPRDTAERADMEPAPEREAPAAPPRREAAEASRGAGTARPTTGKAPEPPAEDESLAPPSVHRLAAEHAIDLGTVPGTGPGGRVTRGDLLLVLEGRGEAGPAAAKASAAAPAPAADAGKGGERRIPMSPIRRRIAERLLAAKQGTAMLTTFNEIDMHRAMQLRGAYQEAFHKRHGVSLGFMSFFVKACVAALGEIPEINAYIDGEDLVYHAHCHIGIAVGAEKGLVVPVLKHAESMRFAEVEQAIVDYVAKIKANKLTLADLEGGTFTITNGGVFGSLLSTPILNMPQSGILGMHKIEKRPVVVDDAIVIRPMMYVALSYDHRIVDGKGAVTFLKRVKELVENPERMMLEV
jgi:2-oxoglutarate dehydrogenase E2 component (dihydrolipoamide succinyltransferase)